MMLKEIFTKVYNCKNLLKSCKSNDKLYWQGQLESFRLVYFHLLTPTQRLGLASGYDAFEKAMIEELGIENDLH